MCEIFGYSIEGLLLTPNAETRGQFRRLGFFDHKSFDGTLETHACIILPGTFYHRTLKPDKDGKSQPIINL